MFRRLKTLFLAEANDALERAEDPIKLTKQAVRDLQDDLAAAREARDRAQALIIAAERDLAKAEADAERYTEQATQLAQMAARGELDEARADALALEALKSKRLASDMEETLKTNLARAKDARAQHAEDVKRLQRELDEARRSLPLLETRAKLNSSSLKIERSLRRSQTSGASATLERVRKKVQEEEDLVRAKRAARGEDADLDMRIDEVLNPKGRDAQAELDAIKAQLRGE